MISEQSRSDDLIFIFNLFEVALRTDGDFLPELTKHVITMTNYVQQYYFFFVELLQTALKLHLRTFIPFLHITNLMLIVVNEVRVLLRLRG